MNAQHDPQQEPAQQAPHPADSPSADSPSADSPSADSPERVQRLHPVNVTHLVFGVVFATFLGIWALVTADVVSNDDLRWLLPVPWLLAGAAGLVVATFGRSGRRQTATPAPAPAPRQHPDL